jgi:hypothetical protein
MAQQRLHQFGSLLFSLTQFEQLFFDVAAITMLSTFVFILIGCIYSQRVSAVEAATNSEQVSIIH